MSYPQKHNKNRRHSRRHIAAWVLLWIMMFVASLALISIFTMQFLGGAAKQNLTSLDWAGYFVNSDQVNPQPSVTGVSGSWIVPGVETSQQDTFSTVWIGIGGQSDVTLIQTGTEQDCVDGQLVYFAWYELLPDYSVVIPEINVSPGDNITASISLVNSYNNIWLVSITDVSTGQRFEENLFYDSSRLSAEWIVERPTVNNTLSNLAQFGAVTFTNLKVTVNGSVGSVSDFPFSRIVMVDRQNYELASVSAFSAKQSSFTVTFISSA